MGARWQHSSPVSARLQVYEVVSVAVGSGRAVTLGTPALPVTPAPPCEGVSIGVEGSGRGVHKAYPVGAALVGLAHAERC